MTSVNHPLGRRLRMALIGGGNQGFIGRVHVMAAALDGRAELVAGAFSSDPTRSRGAAAEFGVSADRGYGSADELMSAESRLPADQRADFVTIATPNHTHFEIARGALGSGFHIVCEKPLTNELDQALTLARLADRVGNVFAVAHGYSGYPMVRQAREMIAAGELGRILAVRVAYIQGGAWRQQAGQPPSRAAWKTDPAQAGPAGTLADIGVHAFHLLRYVTGLRPREICATLARFHPLRTLDDYGHVILRSVDDALATITVSQATHGRLNDIRLEVDGTRGSLTWKHANHERLVVRRHGQPVQVYERNQRIAYSDTVRAACRLPGGHPEGLLEALANLYGDAFDAMVRRADRSADQTPRQPLYPTIADGVEGVYFVHLCLASHAERSAWKPWELATVRGGP